MRGLFPEKDFKDESVPAFDMKIKKLMPMDSESRRLIDWMEKGVYDALQRKYAFSFSYSDSDSQDVTMNINRTGNKKHGGTFNATGDITPNQMRSSACKMVRTLVQLMRTLDKMPDERTIVMKLLYYDDVTPPDYEPPFFRGCTEEEAQVVWTKNPLGMEIGNVNSKHLVLTLKVKSVLDPCEDENDDMQDDGKSTGPDSLHDDQPSDSDSEIIQTQENQFIVAPVEEQDNDDGEVDEDNTQDPVENEQQLARVKDWINSRHLDTLELTDIIANFPDISIVLSEEIMEQLEKEDVLSKIGKDTYIINREKTPGSEFTFVKDELDGQTAQKEGKLIALEDSMYMKDTGPDSVHDDQPCDSFSQVSQTQENQSIVVLLDMKMKKLMPVDAESRRLIDLMSRGIYNALQRKYLKTFTFCICEAANGPVIEKHTFSLSYPDSDRQDVMMKIDLTGNNNSPADIIPNQNQMRSSACEMGSTLAQLMNTLDKIPDEPPDYEPPFFRGCTKEEAQYVLTKKPQRLEAGNLNSVLDPREDENGDMKDDGKSTRLEKKAVDDSGQLHKSQISEFVPVGRSNKIPMVLSEGKPRLDESHYEKAPLIKTTDQLEKEGASSKVCWKINILPTNSKPDRRVVGTRNGAGRARVQAWKTRFQAVKNAVDSSRNRLTTNAVVRTLGPTINDICFGESKKPETLSCWSARVKNNSKEREDENLVLSFQPPERKVNPIKNGAERVNRKWWKLQQSETDRAKIEEEELRVLGAVRDQLYHLLCWAYVACNLISSMRVIEGVDTSFNTLSVKDMCMSTAAKHVKKGRHKCRASEVAVGLEFAKEVGVRKHGKGEEEEFDCMKYKENKKAPRFFIDDYVFLGDSLDKAVRALEEQPIGATVLIFSEYWLTDTEVYRGITKNGSEFHGLHGVMVVDAYFEQGELIFVCKSSHGTEMHKSGYFKISGSTMVLGMHCLPNKHFPVAGLDRGENRMEEESLSKPTPLIYDFIYPTSSAESPKKKKRKVLR